MRRILTSILIIGIVVSVMGVGTFAYFSSDDNWQVTAISGKLEIDLHGDASTSLTLNNLEPGVWTQNYTLKVYNTGISTMSCKYKLYATKDSQTVSGFYEKIDVRLYHGYCAGTEICPVEYLWEGKLSDMLFDSMTDAISECLDPNITHCFLIQFKLNETTDDQYQGASCVFNITAYATQCNNSGW